MLDTCIPLISFEIVYWPACVANALNACNSQRKGIYVKQECTPDVKGLLLLHEY